ncbi:lamin tail domain-containing protein [Myxococcota bacterium]|nr:lamin tail domain-containing protein [Myxococcota bacterium]
MKSSIFFLLSIITLMFTACEDKSGTTEEENVIVMPGKADDFLSMTAQEYVLEGVSSVTLESTFVGASEAEKMERVIELIKYKHVVVGWFLNVLLIEKSDEDPNGEYGGYKSLVKNGAEEDMNITAVDELTYSFTFRQIIGGTNDLLNVLPTTMGADGKRHFDLKMGIISNTTMAKLETNSEWYRSSPWSSFNPANYTADQLEILDLAIWPEERSVDAWIDYNTLFADGLLTIGLHFGWDYHDNYHEKHSNSVYTWLLNTMGFSSPVASYEDLRRDSGPLTKTFTANGKQVKVELSLYWGQKGLDTDPDTYAGGVVLEEDMRSSFSNKEVIIYSGHSGPLYGFALANWRMTDEGDLDDSEVAFMDMPANKYQVVLAEGCDTYALGQAFFENPAKAGHKYIDVITTTNSSNASTPATVQDFLRALFGTDSSGVHQPALYSTLLKDMDSNSYWFSTMYGIHGIDDNPSGHPYANNALLCQQCSKNADCASQGMQCSTLGNEGKVCTSQCTSDKGCPEGYMCVESAQGSYIKSKQCVPLGYSCVNPETPTGPVIIINEVLADPASDLLGDTNLDGVRHFGDDEFVEIVNISDEETDISGWTISDGFMARFTFPAGTIIAPHTAVVVFGGGSITSFNACTAFTTSGGLGLNNSGDTVTLSDQDGKEIDSMTYGSEGGNDKSLTRATDSDPESTFIPHPGNGSSAGLQSDGSSF